MICSLVINNLLGYFWSKYILSHIAYICHEAHYYLNYYLMVPMFDFHKSFYKCEVWFAFSVHRLTCVKIRTHLCNEFKLCFLKAQVHIIWRNCSLQLGASNGRRLFWNNRFRSPLLREPSVCRSQCSLESSDYSVGFEAVELSSQSEDCRREELKGHNQLWDSITF